MIDPQSSAPRLSAARLVCFSGLSLPLGALLLAISVYLPPFLASNIGIGLATIGSAYTLVRLLDVGVDPLLGMMMDRTRPRAGRYRPWIAAGAPVLMISVYALFEAQPGVGFTYLVFWLLIYYLGMSMLNVAHSAWGARLATDYNERSRLFGAMALGMIAGTIAILALPLAATALGWNVAHPTRLIGWMVLGLIPVVTLLLLLTIAEPATGPAASHGISWRNCRALLSQRHLIRMLLVQLTLTLGPGWAGALFLFFFTVTLEFSQAQTGTLLLSYFLAGLAGAPLIAGLAVRIGKHRALIVTTTIYAFTLAAFFFAPQGSMAIALPLLVVAGMMNAGFDLMIRSMLADVADEIQFETGRDQTSLVYGLNSAVNKVALAMGVGLSYPILEWLGFDAALGAQNSDTAIFGLRLLYVLGPTLFTMLGGACLLGWSLDAARHAAIRAELAARDASAQPSLPEQPGVAPQASLAAD